MKVVSKILKLAFVMFFLVALGCVSSSKVIVASELNYANISSFNINKMISNNSSYAKEIDNINVDKDEISFEFESNKILFKTTNNYEFPYPKDYVRNSTYNAKLVKCIKQQGMPCDISNIYNQSRNIVRNYIMNLDFLSDIEKEEAKNVIDNIQVYYGTFFGEDEFEAVKIYKNCEICINSKFDVSKEDIIKAYLEIVIDSTRNNNYDVLNCGIWNDIITDIVVSSLVNKTILSNYNQEIYAPVLFVINKIGLDNIIEAYIRGDYSYIDHTEELRVLYICLDSLNENISKEIRDSTSAIKISIAILN